MVAESLRILILEDNPVDAELVQFELREAGIIFTSKVVMTEKEFVCELQDNCPDLILSDYDLSTYNGAQALAEVRKRCPDTPFILVTGAVTEDRAIEILTQGAKDYVLKTRLEQRLVPAVQRALAEAEEHRTRKQVEAELREAQRNLEEKVKIRTIELEAEVSARKKMEEALREAYERTAAILESIADAFYSLDDQWRFVGVNPAAERAPFGQPASALLGKVIWDVFPEIVGTRIHQHYIDAVEKRSREHYEAQSPLNNRWYEVFMFPRVRGLDVYMRDITERKQAEEKQIQLIRDAKTLATEMDAIFKAQVDAVLIYDTEMNVRRANPSFFKTYGFDPVGLNLEEIVRRVSCRRLDERPLIFEEQPTPQALRGQEMTGVLYRVKKADGTESIVETSSGPMREGDSITGSVTVWRDVTKRMLDEEALRESEHLYHAIGESIDYGIWICDPDGRNIYASKSFLNLVGITQEQCSNFGWGDVLHPDDAERTVEAWKECVRTGSVWDIEHRFRGVDGQWHPVLARGVPVRNEQGDISCWAGINLDIGTLKRAEFSLKERTQQLENANRELESFSYSISHDLRAPLRAINGFARMLARDLKEKLDEQSMHRLDTIMENGLKMNQLIDDVLAFSRLGQESLTMTVFDLGDLAKEVWHELQENNPQQNVFINIAHPIACYGDHQMISRVLTNLLSNAAKFTKERPTVMIEVGSYEEGLEYVYYVKDNGCGFDMQLSDKLFILFQRLHSDADYEGTGAGLSIVKRIIERHGGRVWAEGKVNEGATFYFTLPKMVTMTNNPA